MFNYDFEHNQNVSEHRKKNRNQCYSLNYRSSTPINESIYRSSTTCDGEYCFVSLHTADPTFESIDYVDEEGDKLESRFPGDKGKTNVPKISMSEGYEIEAGCLKISDTSQVTVGCSTEWMGEQSKPTNKHCICKGHLCNYFHQISGEDPTKHRKGAGRGRVNPHDEGAVKTVISGGSKRTWHHAESYCYLVFYEYHLQNGRSLITD